MPDETYNDALSRLERAVKWSAGRFSLILACCNYAALRGQIVEQLNEACPDQNIRQITVRPRTRSLQALISEEIENGTPDAVMILGLESAVNPDEIFRDANHGREHFRNAFSFPMILWLTETLLSRLIHSGPDFYSWAGTSLRFRPSDEELSDALQANAEHVLAEISGRGPYSQGFPADLSDLREFQSFLKDLEPLNIASPSLLFLKGRYAQHIGENDSAIGLPVVMENPERAGTGTCVAVPHGAVL